MGIKNVEQNKPELLQRIASVWTFTYLQCLIISFFLVVILYVSDTLCFPFPEKEVAAIGTPLFLVIIIFCCVIVNCFAMWQNCNCSKKIHFQNVR